MIDTGYEQIIQHQELALDLLNHLTSMCTNYFFLFFPGKIYTFMYVLHINYTNTDYGVVPSTNLHRIYKIQIVMVGLVGTRYTLLPTMLQQLF